MRRLSDLDLTEFTICIPTDLYKKLNSTALHNDLELDYVCDLLFRIAYEFLGIRETIRDLGIEYK